MTTVEEGIGNFRVFQKEAREFFTEWRTRSEEQALARDREAKRVRDEKDEDFQIVNTSIAQSEAQSASRAAIWTAVGGLAAIALLALTIVLAVVGQYVWKHTDVEPYNIFQQLRSERVYTANQDSRVPPVEVHPYGR